MKKTTKPLNKLPVPTRFKCSKSNSVGSTGSMFAQFESEKVRFLFMYACTRNMKVFLSFGRQKFRKSIYPLNFYTLTLLFSKVINLLGFTAFVIGRMGSRGNCSGINIL